MRTALRSLTLASYFALLGLLLAWAVWLSPNPHYPVALVLLILVGPLLLPLRGLLHDRPRAYLWASFLALYYFAMGVSDVAAGEPGYLAWPEVLLALSLFTGGIGTLRLGGQVTPAGADTTA